MSGHFVYEIDERKLRVRLQEFEVETTPEAWTNFEAFYQEAHLQNKDNRSLNFQVPVSMNIVLPVIFGGVIILIAVVLYNFINIKNPPAEKVETTPPATSVEPPKPAVAAVKIDTVKKLPPPTVIPNDSLKNITTAVSPTIAPVATNDKPINNPVSKDTGTQNNVQQKPRIKEYALTEVKQTPKSKKKKSKKTNNDSATQEKAPEDVPVNTPEETEASMKPNVP